MATKKHVEPRFHTGFGVGSSGGAVRPDPIAALGWTLSRHDDGDVLIVDEPSVMAECPYHISARLAERRLDHPSVFGWDGGRNPSGGPW